MKLDRVTEKAYGLFDNKKGIGIKEINLNTGTTKLVSVVETAIQNHPQIKIYDGVVYYLEKDFSNGSMKELLRYVM